MKLRTIVLFLKVSTYFIKNSSVSRLDKVHAIVKLLDQINESFENRYYILGIFIDLSKALTVNHCILLKKLEIYNNRNSNFSWFHSYLKQSKQYIRVADGLKTDLQTIVCGIPQVLNLGPLLFLLYVNDFANCSDQLNSIMFADDINWWI